MTNEPRDGNKNKTKLFYVLWEMNLVIQQRVSGDRVNYNGLPNPSGRTGWDPQRLAQAVRPDG